MRTTKNQDKLPEGFLTRDEEQELARRWRDHRDPKARERILRAYHKLAVSFAMRASRPGIAIDDLIQEAQIGLMSALDRFDPELGFAFATFARYHVISRLQIYTLENLGPVRIFNTAATKGLLGRYAQLRHELSSQGQLDASARQKLCDELGIDDNQLMRFEMAIAVPMSIDVGAGGDDSEAGQRSKPLVSQDDGPDVEALGSIGREEAARMIAEILAGLSEREARIIRERHLSGEPCTLEALSGQLGISRERVRQIELRTLEKIRDAFKERGIASVDDYFD